MLYSFGTREGEERGVLEHDLLAASLVPGLDRNVLVAALHDLREEELFLHYTGRRYRYEPTPNLTKLVRDEANKFSGAEVLAVVRGALEERLRGARHLAVWPDGPGQVPDRVPAFTLAYLSPDWSAEVAPLASFVEEAAGSRRTYRNGLGMVLPDGTQFDRARAAARLKLATESLVANRARHGFTIEQADELKEKAATAARDLAASLDRAYARVVLPVRARGGPGPYELEEVDLRSLLAAGRSLHERVMEALSHRVFRSLTIDKLVSLAGLGPDRPVVDLGQLVDWFFSYFDFTKLVDRSASAMQWPGG